MPDNEIRHGHRLALNLDLYPDLDLDLDTDTVWGPRAGIMNLCSKQVDQLMRTGVVSRPGSP